MNLIRIAAAVIFFLGLIPDLYSLRPVSLESALSKGWVRCRIYSTSADTTPELPGSYYGSCLRLSIESRYRSPLTVELENGRFLEPQDSLEQRMIITREELISLAPGKKKIIPVFAMCTQMHERAPGPETLLAMGNMAGGPLLDLTRFIGKNNYQDITGQEAVWVITDGSSIGDIYSDNEAEMKDLQQFTSKLTGKPVPSAPNTLNYSSGEVSGEIVFENTGKETYSFFMMEESGQRIGNFFENRTIMDPMVTTLTWKFRFRGFQKGVYYVRLVNSKGTIVANRPVVIN